MIVWDKLTSVLAAADDAPYFPVDAYEERRGLFLLRAGALIGLAILVHFPGVFYPWIWTDHRGIAENVLLHSARGRRNSGSIHSIPAARRWAARCSICSILLQDHRPVSSFISRHCWPTR